MRGRRPLPANVHRLRGNPSRLSEAALLDRDQVRPEVAVPTCPRHLTGEARTEWRRISAELVENGLLTRLDRAALAAYCVAWARWVEAERQITALRASGDAGLGLVDRTPNGMKVMGVWLLIANRAAEQLRTFLAEFGLSPAQRARVTPGTVVQLGLPGIEPGARWESVAPSHQTTPGAA